MIIKQINGSNGATLTIKNNVADIKTFETIGWC